MQNISIIIIIVRLHRAQKLCERRGGRPGLPVPNSPYGLCGRKATLIIMEICEAATPRLKALNKHNTYNVH